MKQTKNKIKCVHCKQTNYIKKGFRKTENRGKIQRYKCLDCNKLFTNDEGFYRMKNSEKKITMAIDLYFSNLSSRKVRNHFRRHLEHNASHETVLKWCRKYVLKVQKYIDSLNPKLGDEFYVDETEIDREKNSKDIFWCSVDWETRFINGTHYTTNHSVDNAINFLKKITDNKKLPKFIQTDAAKFYPKAFKRMFFSNKLNYINKQSRRSVEHRVVNYRRTKKHNVRIETVFSKIKDRVDDFRGLKALWSAPILMAGIVLQHNFIEAHTTTGRIPSELAGLNLETGVNRWLGLIKLASA